MAFGGAGLGRPRAQRDRREALVRMRLVHALAELACERGLEHLGKDEVATLAGVGAVEFDAQFRGLEDCVLAGCAEALSRARRNALAAAQGSIEHRPLRALDGVLAFVALESELAGLCLARLLAAGPRVPFPDCYGHSARAAARQLLPALAPAGAALDVLDRRPRCSEASLAQAASLQSVGRAARLLAGLRTLGLLDAAPRSTALTPRGRELKRLFISRAPRVDRALAGVSEELGSSGPPWTLGAAKRPRTKKDTG